MSKLKDVFCVYEYDDMAVSSGTKLSPRGKPEIDFMLDKLRRSVDKLEERWIDSRSLSHNTSTVGNQHRDKSSNINLEGSTRYSKNT